MGITLQGWNIQSGHKTLFVHHLHCGDDLCCDNEQVAGDDVVSWVGHVIAVCEKIGQSDNAQADDDKANARPFAIYQATIEKTLTQ